ncbi:zinc-dependent metalloprotease [Paraconexibacter sp.]|uniref:zinc-dependent metalloprotease n=1 Tax=Paraconexibacter sp. TaxID=2949640 RepID=UPI0035666221
MSGLDRGVAGMVGRLMAGGAEDPWTAPPVDLIGVCDEAAARIAAYTRLTPVGELPPPEWIDRGTWIDLNVEVLAPAVEGPLLRAGGRFASLEGPLQSMLGAVAGAEAGLVTGLLAQRVLGQVEPGLLRDDEDHVTRMVLVAPNLKAVARTLDVPEPDLVRWVAVHELTHAIQFASVPWLKPELNRLVRELMSTLELRLDARSLLRLPNLGDARALLDLVRGGDLLTAFAGEQAREVLDRVQGLMGLIEGHAEHVMDAVGVEVVDDLDRLRTALDARREAERSPLEMLLSRLLGLDEKLRQYGEGRAFCDAVVASGGRRALRRAWDDPASAPTRAELGTPEAWLARIGV